VELLAITGNADPLYPLPFSCNSIADENRTGKLSGNPCHNKSNSIPARMYRLMLVPLTMRSVEKKPVELLAKAQSAFLISTAKT